jgi:hypothetical protein
MEAFQVILMPLARIITSKENKPREKENKPRVSALP